jgi:hypothetical protein
VGPLKSKKGSQNRIGASAVRVVEKRTGELAAPRLSQLSCVPPALRRLLFLVDRLCSDRCKIDNIMNAPDVSKIGFQIGEFKGNSDRLVDWSPLLKLQQSDRWILHVSEDTMVHDGER